MDLGDSEVINNLRKWQRRSNTSVNFFAPERKKNMRSLRGDLHDARHVARVPLYDLSQQPEIA